jgi:UDP-N-acetylglucosamine diphosphorylase/glucosamine-1-phosphate N-acetyltransferase
MIRYLWDLVHLNGDQIKTDAHILFAEQAEGEVPGVAIIGPACDLHIAGTAQIDPMVVVDTSRGPVIIDREAVVAAFSRLEGPCYIGPRAHVLGAKIRSGTTIGPQCRVGGEVEASILQGFSNKYHEGFLGHSYLGEWVNLGAGTQNSDLRNDYGEVDVVVNGAQVETGLKKVGCFIGDHTKTGLGTLLNTGTSAGIFCNLLPAGRLLPKYFPSYCSWWNSTMTPNANLPGLMQTAAAVMQRRGSLLTDMHAALFAHVFDHTAGERQRVMIETDRRRLRRSA